MRRYWTTRDGTRIKITDMTTNHIQNCINYARKNPYMMPPDYMDAFREELDRRYKSGEHK